MRHRWIRRKITLKTAAGLMACLLVGIVSHAGGRRNDSRTDSAGAEFHMARVKYRTFGGGGSHGYYQPWWAIDYPLAEEHFFPALRRMTNLTVDDEEAHLELTDKRIFDYSRGGETGVPLARKPQT